MANRENALEARPMDEVKRELLERARENRNPFLYTIFNEVVPVIESLRSLERDAWAHAFGALAAPHEERAAKAEAEGDAETAHREYLIAYRLLPRGALSGAEFSRQADGISKVAGIVSQGGALFRPAGGTDRNAV
jgi:hypothetical protein